jgi:hypothetical protein
VRHLVAEGLLDDPLPERVISGRGRGSSDPEDPASRQREVRAEGEDPEEGHTPKTPSGDDSPLWLGAPLLMRGA